jgi:hypothetical protein
MKSSSPSILSLLPMAIGEGTFSLVVGGLPISVFSRLLPSVLTVELRCAPLPQLPLPFPPGEMSPSRSRKEGGPPGQGGYSLGYRGWRPTCWNG